MKRVMAIILIIAGIALISYPKLKELYYDHRQAQLLMAWQESMEILERHDLDEAEGIPEGYDDDGDIAEDAASAAARAEAQRALYIQQNTEGILEIKRIDLNLPILKGATERNLLISVSSLDGAACPGEAGNYCIAGHRCRTYGRHFNRLGELEEGDIIQVTTKEKRYIYEVFEKLIVKPEETWVLAPRAEEKLITLVSCDYSSKPTLRLVVRGRLIEENALEK